MSVEVLLKEKNCYASAVVLDVVGKDKCKCKLNINGDELTVERSCLRTAPEEFKGKFKPSAGTTVEVSSDSMTEPGGDGSVPYPCWWIATVEQAKGDFYHIKYKGWEKRYDEIVEADRLRPHTPESMMMPNVEKHTIDVPESLNDWVHNPENLRQHIKDKCGAWGLALAHPKGGNKSGNKGKGKSNLRLVLLGEKIACSKAEMLLKLHAKHQVGLRGLKAEVSALEETLESERQKRGSSIVEEFTIDTDLIGMVVGKGGSNIRNAESESGVHSAIVEGGKVTIHGPNRESVEKCRELLEMVKEEVEVSKDQLGWIIGKKGANIRELMAETSVTRAEVSKGTEPPKMMLIGTRASVEQGKLWLQCHTDYLEEMESQEAELRQLNRDLESTTVGGRRGPGGKGGRGRGRGGGAGGRGNGAIPEPRVAEPQVAPAPKPPAPRAASSEDKPAPKPKSQGNAKKDKGAAAPKPAPKPKEAVPKSAEPKAKPAPKPAPKPAENKGSAEPAIPKPLEATGKPQRQKKNKSGDKNKSEN